MYFFNKDFFNSDVSEKEEFKQVLLMSHEIGHHWMGNLVTMQWWNDLWINETGFESVISPKTVAWLFA